MRASKRLRAEALRTLTATHYEEGNQRKCYKAIWRRFVAPVYGINYRSYLRLLQGVSHPGQAG